jgi:hypothetical protein
MNSYWHKRTAAAFAAVLAFGASAAPLAAQDELTITGLGLFSQAGGAGPMEQLPQYGLLPFKVGDSCYGWFMFFEPVNAAVELEELLVIPGPAEVWNSDEPSVVSQDRESARTPLVFDGYNGAAYHAWCVAEGDPEGVYTFVISRAGETLGRLSFRLER